MGLTLDAATSWAVLAAISWEHTISSSNFPLPCTTRSAASLTVKKGQDGLCHCCTVAVTAATPYDPTSRPPSSPWQPGRTACLPRPWAAPRDPGSLLNFSSYWLPYQPYLSKRKIFFFAFVILWGDQRNWGGVRSLGTNRYLHHDRGSPAHSFGGWDESFCPSRILSIKLFRRCCALGKWEIIIATFYLVPVMCQVLLYILVLYIQFSQ